MTNNRLEVLINAYADCLNSLVIQLMVVLDKSESQDIENLENLMKDLLDTATIISEDLFEEIANINSLNSPEWRKLRQLSKTVQQQLQIELEINTTVIRNFINYWLHP